MVLSMVGPTEVAAEYATIIVLTSIEAASALGTTFAWRGRVGPSTTLGYDVEVQ